jgi:predicted DsbA family dithiol-disulfide isomerase
VRWLPFQLNPDLPEAGIPREEYVARKFGARGKGVNERVTMAGRQVDIPFAYEKMQVQPNTLNAHRLMLFAEHAGRQDELAEALFRAHFTEGANLTDRETLAGIAERAGLDRKAAADYLAGDADRDAIARADVEARSAGINGVPFFIFNRKVGVSGAQDPETLLDAMEQALHDSGR